MGRVDQASRIVESAVSFAGWQDVISQHGGLFRASAGFQQETLVVMPTTLLTIPGLSTLPVGSEQTLPDLVQQLEPVLANYAGDFEISPGRRSSGCGVPWGLIASPRPQQERMSHYLYETQ